MQRNLETLGVMTEVYLGVISLPDVSPKVLTVKVHIGGR